MKSRHFVERSAAGCFLALACCSVMLAQDALTATRKGLELMGQARYGEAEEFLHRALEIAGPADSTAVYNLANLYHRQGRFQEAERLHPAWLWSRLSAIMVPRPGGRSVLERFGRTVPIRRKIFPGD